MKIAVVTPFHGVRKEWVEKCLRSVARQTQPCTHFVVCDGDDSLDVTAFPQVQVIRLPQAHKDFGNAARAVGMVAASAQGFDAIAFLDADNWYDADHLEMLADNHERTGAWVCTSSRKLYDQEGELLGQCPEVEGETFVDTNCLFVARPAFFLMSAWYLMPREVVETGDRVVWEVIVNSKVARSHVHRPTVNYRTRHASHYRYFHKDPPANAKSISLSIPKKFFPLSGFMPAFHLAGQSAAPAPVPAPAPQHVAKERVSLCMIVKNEEHNLESCLRPMIGLMDEIIIVDTGSTDNTVAVAESLGAKVVHHAWQDSFAAARNAGLRQATGEWIFWLDADDRLDNENIQRLKKLLHILPRENNAYMMQQWSWPTLGTTTPSVVDHARLFRKHPGIEWTYRVHEQILPSLNQTGVHLVYTDIVIQHAGYQDPVLRLKKVDRNLRLLLMEHAEQPKEAFVLYNLASVALARAETDQAINYLRACIENAAPGSSFLPSAFLRLSENLQAKGDLEAAINYCRQGRKRFPIEPMLWFREGAMSLTRKDCAHAQECFEHLLQMPEGRCQVPPEPGVRGYLSRHNLAVALRDQGQLADAEKHWRVAVQEAPSFESAWLGLTDLLMQQNRRRDIEALVDPLAADPARDVVVAGVRGRILSAVKDHTAARNILAPAVARHPKSVWLRLFLADALISEGKELYETEKQLKEILELDPGQQQIRLLLGQLRERYGDQLAREAEVRRLAKPVQPSAARTAAIAGRAEKVSLCMIVKNEEDNLAACLRPVMGLMYETIVVDTGSTDRTVEVANSLGAKVFHFAWQDSFAAARNEALSHATGDWIMWLDADDRFDETNVAKLRRLLANLPPNNFGYMMKQWSLPTEGSSSCILVDHVRLFRRQPGVCWSYRVHEQILPALQKAGGQIVQTDIVIHHMGYTDPAFRLKKVERNFRLLQRDHAEQPEDAFTLFNLAGVSLDRGEFREAIPYLHGCLKYAPANASFIGQTYMRLAEAHLALGSIDEALRVCREGKDKYPDEVVLWFQEGTICLNRKDYAQAQRTFEYILQMSAKPCLMPVESGVRGHLARHNLAVALFEQKKYLEAEQSWRAALAEAPNLEAAWLGLTDLLHRQQRDAELDETLRTVAAEPTRTALAAGLRGRVCSNRKDFTGAIHHLRPAVQHSPRNQWMRQLLIDALLREGKDLDAAEKYTHELLALDPRHKQAQAWLEQIQRKKTETIFI